ncbi:MAG: 16S rRNA (cytosine(1402)-N(4))-methyltransferase [Clostridia bacterium]
MNDTSFHHLPVLFDEVMAWMNPQSGGVYADGTLGGGGHSAGLLERSGGTATLYGIDRDEAAIAAATARLGAYAGFHALHGNFHNAKALLAEAGAPPLNGALLDLGVSSYQLDTGERGFSYHENAPLDMRMDPLHGRNRGRVPRTHYAGGISTHSYGIWRGKMGGAHRGDL